MVSISRDVLPVVRFPMINSLCPRPIGNNASITIVPVSRGLEIGCRSIMPGTVCSTGDIFSNSIGPSASRGWPMELITRPINLSPTGMLKTVLVRLAVSCSITGWVLSIKTTET